MSFATTSEYFQVLQRIMCYVMKSIQFSSQVDESSPAIQSHPAKGKETIRNDKF